MPASSLISDQLRAAILAAPLTPYRLAELAAVPRSAISRFLSGKSGLSVDTADRVAGVLGLRLVQTRRVQRAGRRVTKSENRRTDRPTPRTAQSDP